MNKVLLMGRLTRDPEVRYTTDSEQTAIAKFTLAVDRRYKREGEPDADFISCVAFGKTAEFIEKHIIKGTKIAVEGNLRTGSYDNKEGRKIYTNDCIIEQIEFAESKKKDEPHPDPKVDENGFMNIPQGLDEELPFR